MVLSVFFSGMMLPLAITNAIASISVLSNVSACWLANLIYSYEC